jgi:hypothetical protein
LEPTVGWEFFNSMPRPTTSPTMGTLLMMMMIYDDHDAEEEEEEDKDFGDDSDNDSDDENTGRPTWEPTVGWEFFNSMPKPTTSPTMGKMVMIWW